MPRELYDELTLSLDGRDSSLTGLETDTVLRPRSHASDLDDSHKSRWCKLLGRLPTRRLEGPWACANKVQLRWFTRGGSRAQPPIVGNSHKGLGLGKLRDRVQELELRVRASTSYYLYTTTVNSNPRVRTLLVMYSKRV